MENTKKPTNLDFLFSQLIINFSHLLSNKQISKQEFAEVVKNSYDISNPKTALFYQSILRSNFYTIRLNLYGDTILFNH